MWTPRVNAVLGSLVVTVGLWLTWGELPLIWVAALALGILAFLDWQGSTIGHVWAWATLLLGLESLAWPIATMVQVRMVTAEPTDRQMGDILNAVVWGLPSGVFWLTLSYGTFKRLWQKEAEVAGQR
jgi:hypothetical protein